MNGLVETLALSAEEEARGVSEVNIAVNQMDQITQQNAAMVEQSTAASHSLSEEARTLAAIVAQFKVGDVATKATVPTQVKLQRVS
jgi:methyl-accepting chemotaxis protein